MKKDNSFWQKEALFSRESLNNLMGIGLGIALTLSFTDGVGNLAHTRRVLSLVALTVLAVSSIGLLKKGRTK